MNAEQGFPLITISSAPVKVSDGAGEDTPLQDRGHWANKTEYLLAVLGHVVGLGNVWRFPYLCYRNGGGVFFVPYLLFLAICGIPLFLLETSLGQYTSLGGVCAWRNFCPLFGGLGYATQIMILHGCVYYTTVLAWALYYLVHSFQPQLPWSHCNNTWNTGTQHIVLHYRNSFVVVYFTATFPFFTLLVLLIRGITLPGADQGIIYYLKPNPTRLADPQVLDCFTLCILNSGTSIVAGFAVFSILGFMAQEQGIDISEVAQSVTDLYPTFIRKGYRRELLLLLLCAVSFLLGLIMITPGGLYVFQIYDHYSCSGPSLLLLSIFQTMAVGWLYGPDRYFSAIKGMIGYRPWPVFKVCWRYLTPILSTGTFFFSLVRWTPPVLAKRLVAPGWAIGLGWLLTLSSVSMLPVWATYALLKTPGSLHKRIYQLKNG
ncbi:hypothetical protein JZ751_006449, partial [Albula glossodonta]